MCPLYMTMSDLPILANSSKWKNPAKPRRQTDKVRMLANDASCWPNLDTSVERMSGVVGSLFVVAHANFQQGLALSVGES